MRTFLIAPYYISWHYTTAIISYFKIWSNFLWFVNDFFSIQILIRTLFAPWQRIRENYNAGSLDVQGFFESLVANILMRIVGAIVRLITIIIGIIFLLIVFTAGLLGFFIWLLLPFLILFVFIFSLISLYKYFVI